MSDPRIAGAGVTHFGKHPERTGRDLFAEAGLEALSAAGIDPETFNSSVVNATAVGRTGGNPDLTDETAESYSVGFTWEPRWVDNLIIGADHFDIELSNAITSLDLTDLMEMAAD